MEKKLIAKRKKLRYIAQELDKHPTQAMKDLYDKALQELKDLTHQFNQEVVELLKLTNIEDIIGLYFEDDLDEEKNLEHYHEAFTELNKLQMIIAKQAIFYADYIEEELDEYYYEGDD